jgi:SWI/SNF-related matrix-associated actin-dependent regulator 1 of chromatin subfamily A
MIVRGRTKDPQAVIDAPIVILSYGMAGKINAGPRDMLIIDESHYIKNPKAKRTAAVLELADRTRHVLSLTGTPLLNRPVELWTQLRAVQGKKCMGWWHYVSRYCAAHRSQYGMDVSGAANLQELNRLFRSVAVRRVKKDVLKELPDIIRQTVYAGAMRSGQSPFVTKIVALLVEHDWDPKKVIDSLSKEDRKGLMGDVFREFADNADAKAENPDVLDYLTDVLTQDDEKALVFSAHHVLMDAVQDICVKNGIGHIRIDQNAAPEERQGLVDRFQSDPDCRVAVLSYGTGKEGLNLTAATRAVLAELDWSPGALSQAVARAHRIGQDMPVHAITVIASEFEDILHATIAQKAAVITQSVDGGKDSGERGLLEGLIKEVAARKEELTKKAGDAQLAAHRALEAFEHGFGSGKRRTNTRAVA